MTEHVDPGDVMQPAKARSCAAECMCGAEIPYEEVMRDGQMVGTRDECRCCQELGQAPPDCPWCSLPGAKERSRLICDDRDVTYRCDHCTNEYDVPMLRELLLGREVSRILMQGAGGGEWRAFYGLICAAARKLKVIR